ncbi:MAG: hypothetical protein QOK11_1038 [Pseudonocardiales bacterium]|jgi:hypothetical protein|nr:hypothetical protein [Pseudonocardiales bacterium]
MPHLVRGDAEVPVDACLTYTNEPPTNSTTGHPTDTINVMGSTAKDGSVVPDIRPEKPRLVRGRTETRMDQLICQLEGPLLSGTRAITPSGDQ